MKASKQASHAGLRAILAVMILGLTGGHWAILQSVAWTRMIIDYSRSSSLQTAVGQTFDGRHPCELCRLIQTAKESSQPHELQQTSVTYDPLFLAILADRFYEPPCSRVPRPVFAVHPSRSDPPPVPPPRRFPGYS